MSDLTDFLLARIAEDEAVALAVDAARFGWVSVDWNSTECETFGLRHDPARVLAECQAKRRIVEEEPATVRDGAHYQWERSLRLLTLPYADHPAYRDEWKP